MRPLSWRHLRAITSGLRVRKAAARSLIAASLLPLLWPAMSAARDPWQEEDEVKAAYVYKFAHFVTWPSELEKTAYHPHQIQVCVTGRASFERALIKTVASHQANEKNIEVRRVDPGDSTASCQMLFIASSISDRSEEIIDSVGTLPILTIGEFEGFAQRGGMINFSIEGRKVRLQVNRRATERSGLRVSSQVLKLAQLVTEDPA